MLLRAIVLPVWLCAAHMCRADESVQVIEPYIEFHTGPGRGYPVFHVGQRGDWLSVIKRQTDWFLVRASDGKEGWVARTQLELTMTESGFMKQFRDIVMDDYLTKHLELGLSAGAMEGNRSFSAHVNYEMAPQFSLELGVGQVSGTFHTSRLVSAALVGQPFRAKQTAPHLLIGVGQFDEAPRDTLVDPASSNNISAIAGIGARHYLSRRLVLRVDWRDYIVRVDDNNTRNFNELSGGLSFFF